MFSRLKSFFCVAGNGFRAPQRIFWTGFIIRILYMTLAHTYRINVRQDHFNFGWETGRIARALATGYGYADPFMGHSGPTTWISPLFTVIMAGVFKVFGVYSVKSAWVTFALTSLFSAATAPAVYEIATRCYHANIYGRARATSVALWSGWLWALYPAAMQYSVRWIWDTSLSAFLLTWAILFALRVRGIGESEDSHRNNTIRWTIFGLLWGLISLCNPSLLLCLPACIVWILWGMRSSVRSFSIQSARAVLAALIVSACLAPWIYRNWLAFHAFIPARGNLGAELYQATLESNDGYPWGPTLPLVETAPDFQHYKQVGELAYVREKSIAAKANIHDHPHLIAKWTLLRVYFFWGGIPHTFDRNYVTEITRDINFAFLSVSGLLGLFLSIKRRVPGAWLFAAIFLLDPVIYYVVTVQSRFRHPLEPLISILTVFLFQSAEPGFKRTAKAEA